MVRAPNDLLLVVDCGLSSVLILPDLSSAFDTVDLDASVSCLEHSVVASEVALDRVVSYLSDRSFLVTLLFTLLPSLVACPRGPSWVI